MPMMSELLFRYNSEPFSTGCNLYMKYKLNLVLAPTVIITTLIITGCGSSSSGTSTPTGTDSSLSAEQELGKKLFFDVSLSSEGNQSCADCHSPSSGFADPVATQAAPVSEGSVTGEFGNRNAPTSSYAAFIPDFSKTSSLTDGGTTSHYQGGQFLDGRALDLIEQAKGPFLNPVEMNNSDAAEVVTKVASASYADDFLSVYGATALDDTDTAYTNIATSIAAFEESAEMSPFSSKFDAWRAGKYSLTASEDRGLQLFMNDAKCANCHTLALPPESAANDETIFSDFNYFNIGVPVNPSNPSSDIDIGLAANSNIDAADVAI
jgi:cytochrome c peroxidase